MKFGVFSHVASAYAPSRLVEEARKAGFEARSINYGDLDFSINKSEIKIFEKGKPLPDFDFLIFRSAGGTFYYVPQRDYLISHFEKRGSVILNKKTYQVWPRLDKLTQHFVLCQSGLPAVETLLFAGKERLLKNFKAPQVVKSYFGSQGKKVFKVENREELEKILEEYLPGNLLIQPVLPGGKDVRVIVLGGKAIGAMKRIAPEGKFLTNYSAGGRVENFPLESEVKKLAEKAAEAFFLDYVGVDLMEDEKGNWKILEVNRACQFEGFEKATGINVASRTVDFLLKKK